MWQLKILLMVFSLIGTAALMSQPAFAHGDELHEHEEDAASKPLRDTVKSGAFRVYDQVVAECTRDVMGGSPAEAAKKGSKTATKMNGEKIKDIQNCMKAKGIDARFEDYYAGGNKDHKGPLTMDPAKAADLQVIQEKLDRGNNLSSQENVLKPATQEIVPPVPAPATPILPSVLPEDYKPKSATSRKYWVDTD